MPNFKLAFWNMQRFNGRSASWPERIQPMKQWLASLAPDVFCACEIGAQGVAAIEEDLPYICVGYYDPTNGQDPDKQSQLGLAMFRRNSFAGAGRAVASGGGTSKRGIIAYDVDGIRVIGVHQYANNDIENFESGLDLLCGAEKTIVIGDFNWDFKHDEAIAANGRFLGNTSIVAHCMLPVGAGEVTLSETYRSNRVGPAACLFDYLLYRGPIGVVAKPYCGGNPEWNAYNYSDHRPIVYQVTP